jgi:hypothetical protein
MFKDQKQRDLYSAYVNARAETWRIHDKLVEQQGLNKTQLYEHPDYTNAIKAEHQAFHKYRNT